MAYPVLAAKDTWYKSTSVDKYLDIGLITIFDSLTDCSKTESDFTEIWNADVNNNGDIKAGVFPITDDTGADTGKYHCYLIGNGNGKIALNPDSNAVFGLMCSLTRINNAHLLDTSEVTDLQFAFSCGNSTGGSKLEYVDVSTWNLNKCQVLYCMFYNCVNLTSIDVTNWNTSNVVVTMRMFAGCTSLTSIGDLSNWNMSNNTNASGMFVNCYCLESIGDLSNWNVSKIKKMGSIFENCHKLTGIGNITNWSPASCTDMSFMFYSCSSIKEIDVSNWDVSKVQSFDHFAAHAGLRRKGVENWKTTSATNMNALFHNCAEEELDLSGWDVSKVQFFCQMFENSPNLKRIKGLEKWNTSAGLGFDGMFERCSKLEELDLSSFDTSKAKNGVDGSTNGHKTATLNNMFLSCNNLKKVKVGPKFSINGDGSNTTAANKAILPTPSTDYIEGADGMWYAFNGEPHAPNAIKDKTAETYFASYALCADQDIIVKNGSMIDTAKAIREKNGTTDHYTPAQFGAAIRALN